MSASAKTSTPEVQAILKFMQSQPLEPFIAAVLHEKLKFACLESTTNLRMKNLAAYGNHGIRTLGLVRMKHKGRYGNYMQYVYDPDIKPRIEPFEALEKVWGTPVRVPSIGKSMITHRGI
jgi:hypothetical protein